MPNNYTIYAQVISECTGFLKMHIRKQPPYTAKTIKEKKALIYRGCVNLKLFLGLFYNSVNQIFYIYSATTRKRDGQQKMDVGDRIF